MRNLKKILALVLALVTAISVMSVASAASFTDGTSADYADAVEVLNAIGVFRGYEDGTFKPQNTITRAEVAAIIYRIDTHDVDDEQVQIYADYNRFSDVKSSDWFAGYVNYCANAEYVNGYGDDTFGPNDKVTGYQALAMILRAVGYDKNDEFSGSAWQIEVAKYANKLGITDNVSANTLGVAATRELIANLLWRTIYMVPQVTYTPALGYNQHKDIVNKNDTNLNNTINEDWLIIEPFDKNDNENDQWGRPSYGFYVYYGTRYQDILIQHAYTPDFEAYTAVTECEIATALGLTKNNQYVTLYTNGRPSTKLINRLETDKTEKDHLVGAQGTYVAVYNFPYESTNDVVVLIDTYLSTVTASQPQTTDKAGHIIAAKSNVTVYYGENDLDVTFTIPGEYTLGSKLLASVYLTPVYKTDANDEYVLDADGNLIIVDWKRNLDYFSDFGLRTPTAITAAQSNIAWNRGYHVIGGEKYMDNVNFYHDEAGFDKSNNWTWYFDENNNVIGSFKYTTPANYAVVLGAQWINGIGVNGYVQAKVQYMDGTVVEDAVIAKVNGKAMQYAGAYPAAAEADKSFNDGYAYTTWQYNDDTAEHLYAVTTNANGTLSLTAVTPEYNGLTITKGVSQFADGDTDATNNVYADSATLFVYWNDDNYNGKKDATELRMVQGYNAKNLFTEYGGKVGAYGVDVVTASNKTFAQIVYIADALDLREYDDSAVFYAYFTSEAHTDDAYNRFFTIDGVIGKDGKAVALYFAPYGQYGDTMLETEVALNAMVAMYKNVLVKVTVGKDGYVADLEPIFTGDVYKQSTVTLAPYGTYKFYNTDVVKIGDLALNITSTTNFFNEEGEVVKFNDMANLYGQNLYIIYNAKTAKAETIIITDTDNAVQTAHNFLNGLTYKHFVTEVEGLVYTVDADTNAGKLTYTVANDTTVYEADLVALIEDSGVADALALAGFELKAEYVTTTYSATNKLVNVVVTLDAGFGKTYDVEMSFQVKYVKGQF